MKKRLFPAMLCLALALPLSLALAVGSFTLDVDALDLTSLNDSQYVEAHLTSNAAGISVCKSVSPSSEVAAYVRLTLMQMDSHTLLFDKDYGYQSGQFDSGVVYLPLSDGTTPYLVTLYVGDQVYAVPFMHTAASGAAPARSAGQEKKDACADENPGWVDATAAPDTVVAGSWYDSSWEEPTVASGWEDPDTGWEEGAGW